MAETTSLKALACKVLQRNNTRNTHETEAISSVSSSKASETEQVHDEEYYTTYYNERAAIREHDGGQTRSEAEYNARLETLMEFAKYEHPEIFNAFNSIFQPEPLII